MRSFPVQALAALLLLGGLSTVAEAQSIGDIGNIPRIHGPGGHAFVNDLPFSHRYQYGISPQFYFNGDGRELWYQDYLDRVDRAEKFGYPHPDRPRYGYPPHYDQPRPLERLRIGFGIFKRW